MPIYEYLCPHCHHPFELLVRGSEQPSCPQCGSEHVDKQLSVPAATSGRPAELSISPGPGGMCGRPQCGMGGCQGLG